MDCNNEVMSESDEQFIESIFEDLDISPKECPIDGQHIHVCSEPLIAEEIVQQDIETTVETKPNTDFCCSLSLINTFDTSVTKNESTVEVKEEEIQLVDNKAIDESEAKSVEESNSCEQTDEVTKSGDNYLNTIVGKKYQLKHRWQLWFWRAEPGVKVVWHSALQRVSKPFETIEDFWRLYHHIVCVQHLVPPSDYCMFKEGIDPMWEDSRNINGGKWSLEFPKGAKRLDTGLNEIWLEVLLCLIGEGFDDFSDEICGAVVNIRSKEDRISVWTANFDKSVANLKIGEILKMRTGYEGQLKYEAHSTSQRIAQEKEKQYTIRSKPKPKQLIRRSCAF